VSTKAPSETGLVTGEEPLAMGDIGPCDVRKKIEEYFAIGVERVWVVEPDNRAVLVYRSATEMERLAETDILRGEGVLQGFEMPIATLFSEE